MPRLFYNSRRDVMRIFMIKNNCDKYQHFLPADDSSRLFGEFDGTPKAQNWSPPAVWIQRRRQLGLIIDSAAFSVTSKEALSTFRSLSSSA